MIYVDGENNTSQFNTTLSVPKWNAKVNATAIDILVGFDEVISIKVLPSNVTGIALVDINGTGYYVNLTDGVAKLVVKDLKAGNYTAYVTYEGDDRYNRAYTTVEFEVKPAITIDVDGSKNSTIVVVNVPGNETAGNVTIIINGTNYTADVINGTATFNLTNVTPGTHNATIIYVDGENHTAEINTTITLPKWKSEINATAVNIREGDVEVIRVEVTPGATGLVLVEINGKGYYVNLTSSKGRFEITGLSKGDYSNVKVTYLGDDRYAESATTVSFKVSEGIKIDVDGTGNSTNVTVTVPGNETGGNVTIIIDNRTIGTSNVTNGTGTVDLGNMTPGEHNITVIYVDANGTETTVNTTITVPKWDSSVSAAAVNIREGDVEEIAIAVTPDKATGRVVVDIDGKGYYANLTGGKATIKVAGLKEGTYDAVVTYLGDDVYENSTITVSFKVSKGIEIDAGGDANSTVVNITVPDNGTGNVTVIIDNKTYIVTNVTNGTGTVDLGNLTPGEHNITVIYTDGNGTNSTVTDTFTVDYIDTPIKVTVSDIKVGETAQIIVEVPSGATGSITIEINGVSYTEKIDAGKATFNVDNLEFGTKTVAVDYAGDASYAANHTTANFTVSKNPASIAISVEGANVGETATVTLTDIPSDATGYVIVTVNGVQYGINLTNGEKSVKVPVLAKGQNNVTATYLGDHKYLSNATEGSFIANRTQGKTEITVENATVGQDVIVKVTVPEDATGNVTIKVDNTTKVVNVTGGENIIPVPGLGEGEHDINVTYSGDDKYDSKTLIDTVVVRPSIIAQDKMTRGWNMTDTCLWTLMWHLP